MTPDELRALADKATPGPWEVGTAGRWFTVHDRPWHRDKPAFDAAVARAPTDARLIALAPDLARLCAELGEALVEISDTTRHNSKLPDFRLPFEIARAALAKLADLEAAA